MTAVPCEVCGFVYDTSTSRHSAATIRAGVEELASILEATTEVRARPRPETWSILEYCCHVRDGLLVQRERVLLARRTDRPALETMGRDERVEHDGYAAQDPIAVARQLRDAATLFTGVLDRLDDETWVRTLIYRYPTTEERTLEWVAVHTEHEVRHHLHDVRAQLG